MRKDIERYHGPDDLPSELPVFPVSGVMLLPRGQLPLNIFEPRYLALVDHIMAAPHRLVGIVQPRLDERHPQHPDLCDIGCIGRLTHWNETDDGRYLITLCGVSRFRLLDEIADERAFRTFHIDSTPFTVDFERRCGEGAVEREALLVALRAFLDIHGLEANWDGFGEACNEVLVNAMAMMCPFTPEEKQILLESVDLKTRADTMIAIAECHVATACGQARPLQ